jgi:hypothetical protein
MVITVKILFQQLSILVSQITVADTSLFSARSTRSYSSDSDDCAEIGMYKGDKYLIFKTQVH